MKAVAIPMLSFSFLFSPTLQAAQYLVDIQATEPETGHTIGVYGRIDVDVITDEILDSSLSVVHQSDPPIPLPRFPFVDYDGLDFVDDAGKLFVALRGGTSAGRVQWQNSTPRPGASGWFRVDDNPLQSGIVSIDVSTSYYGSPVVVYEGVEPSFLGSAVPEPSALMLTLVGLGVAVASSRRNRQIGARAPTCPNRFFPSALQNADISRQRVYFNKTI